jgi:hypothetical protein
MILRKMSDYKKPLGKQIANKPLGVQIVGKPLGIQVAKNPVGKQIMKQLKLPEYPKDPDFQDPKEVKNPDLRSRMLKRRVTESFGSLKNN